MKKHIFFFFTFLFFTSFSFSQNYIVINQESKRINNHPFLMSRITYEIAAFRNSWENMKKREEEVNKAQAQLSIIKKVYNEVDSYPERIVDGWHIVMATDNYNYCSPAKVLIQDNQIIEFVISNWSKMSIPFHMLSPIENAMALITLDFNDNTDVLELYFINDLREPKVTEQPLRSGFVKFWSDIRNAHRIKLWLEGDYLENIPKRSKDEPECGEDGSITLELKPGFYTFKAAGKGRISWEGTFEIKEDTCLDFELNKDNRAR